MDELRQGCRRHRRRHGRRPRLYEAVRAEGAKVVGGSRTQANLDETLAQVRAGGGEGIVVARDLAATWGRKVVQAAIKAYGKVDILVHAAGVGYSWMKRAPAR